LDLEGIHLILHQVHVAPSPSSFNLVSNSEMCDTVTTNADQVPQWTLLAATTSTRLSSSFTAVESDAAKEDGHRPHPAPSPGLEQLRFTGPPAQCPPPIMQSILPRAVRRPLPVGRPVGLGRMVVQGSYCRPSRQVSQGVSAAPLAFRIQQSTHPQSPP
jgi:hypothetical protein